MVNDLSSPSAVALITKSSLFSSDWYESKYTDVALTGLSAAEHYLRVGAALGRNPSEHFSSAAYLERYTDVACRGDNPLVHYEMHGKGEGREPKPGAPVAPADRVDVVVPVFNALEDVRACLKSLAQVNNRAVVRVLIVNDGSDDATSQFLRGFVADVAASNVTFRLIEHDENKGYTRAVNTGLKASEGRYVVTLNSDTIATDHWVDGLVRCMNSAPEVGVVGPLTNAGSWQNVPALRGADGKFAINDLGEMTPAEMADAVRFAAVPRYPRLTFLNGFCFMASREVIDAIGYMDEAAFPVGYGEENDFCVRAQDAGFELAVADDTYVFHAKSKSFGTAKKEQLSKAGGEALHAKHGHEKFDRLVTRVADTAIMDDVRARVRSVLARRKMPTGELSADLLTELEVLFVLPVRGGGGGVHSIVQEVEAMRDVGLGAKVAVRSGDLADYHALYADMPDVEAIFVPFEHDGDLPFIAQDFDVLVATIHTSVPLVESVTRHLPWILPAYYAQDYEPLFHEADTPLWHQARQSYEQLKGAVVFAKTHWICDTIRENHGVEVRKVEPSIDHSVYNIRGKAAKSRQEGTVVAAMIRPRTPRRGAERTLKFLNSVKRRLGDEVRIEVFGCGDDELAALDAPKGTTNHGVLTRQGVADLLKGSDVFVDLSDYQAFGRTSLEAMACGTVAIIPKVGGGHEYAQHGYNALVADNDDLDVAAEELITLLSSPVRLAMTRRRALETAIKYSPHRAAMSELLVLSEALALHRAKHEVPLRKKLAVVQEPLPVTEAVLGRAFGTYLSPSLLEDWHVSVVPPDTEAPVQADVLVIPQASAEALSEEALDAMIGPDTAVVVDQATDEPLPEAIAEKASVVTSRLEGSSLQTAVAARWALTLPEAPDPEAPRPNKPLRIGYYGTPEDAEALNEVADAIKAALSRRNVEFHVAGVFREGKPSVGGRRITLPKRYNDPDFSQDLFVDWLKQALLCDIFIVPDHTDPLGKFVLGCLFNAAILTGGQAELDHIVRPGTDCLAVGHRGIESWEDGLTRLIEDADLRLKLAKAASEGAQGRFQDYNLPALRAALREAVTNG